MNQCERCQKVVPEGRCILCSKMICYLNRRRGKYCMRCYSNEKSFVTIEINKKIYKYFCGCIT